MEYGPDEGDEEATRDAAPRPTRTGHPTGGVRIIGAETAAEITSEVPVVPPAHVTPETAPHSSVRILDEPATRRDQPVPPVATHRPSSRTGPNRPPARSPRCWPVTKGSPPPSSRPPGAKRTPTGWPTRRSSSPRCSVASRPPWARSTSRAAVDEERRPWEFDLSSVRPGQPGPSSSSGPSHRAGRGGRAGRDETMPTRSPASHAVASDRSRPTRRAKPPRSSWWPTWWPPAPLPDEPEVDPDPTGVTPAVGPEPGPLDRGSAVVVEPTRPGPRARPGWAGPDGPACAPTA